MDSMEQTPPASQFVYVTYIRTSPKSLWLALTEPAITRQYWCDTTQESDWQPGSSWRIVTPDGRTADEGEILEIEPAKRLVVTWRHQLNAEMHAEGFSRLTYEFRPMGEMVRFELTHGIDVSESKLIQAISSGWPMILSSLKSLLETGESLAETRRWPEGM
jgi:uncharacterized protein YndB with AHSA1/START domain